MFGNEEQTIIAPAVEAARHEGLDAHGPYPADTLMVRARDGEFDAVVAMYHDQGHIALKLLGMHAAVNVTLRPDAGVISHACRYAYCVGACLFEFRGKHQGFHGCIPSPHDIIVTVYPADNLEIIPTDLLYLRNDIRAELYAALNSPILVLSHIGRWRKKIIG